MEAEWKDILPLFHLILVAVIQGATEFLPVSSSGHLILLPFVIDIQDQGRVIDVAAHTGTLFAVMLYFRRDVASLFHGLIQMAAGRFAAQQAGFLLCLVISTVPVMVLGAVFALTGLAELLRNPSLIGWTTLVFGIVLYWADKRGKSTKSCEDWIVPDAIRVGLWQAVALIPGASRSGVAITGARFLGYERREAARLAMIMSMPTILAASVLTGAGAASALQYEVLRDGAIVAVISFFVALAALSLMMRFLRATSFTPYVVYRILLGLVIILVTST